MRTSCSLPLACPRELWGLSIRWGPHLCQFHFCPPSPLGFQHTDLGDTQMLGPQQSESPALAPVPLSRVPRTWRERGPGEGRLSPCWPGCLQCWDSGKNRAAQRGLGTCRRPHSGLERACPQGSCASAKALSSAWCCGDVVGPDGRSQVPRGMPVPLSLSLPCCLEVRGFALTWLPP